MRQIARSVQITPMAIYRHFANKEQLVLEMLAQGFTSFGSYLDRREAGNTPIERLEHLAEGFFEFALENNAYFELMFLSSQTPTGLRNRNNVLSASRPTYRKLQACVQDCIDAGEIADTHSKDISLDILAFCVGHVALYISGNVIHPSKQPKRVLMHAFSNHIRLLKPRQGI